MCKIIWNFPHSTLILNIALYGHTCIFSKGITRMINMFFLFIGVLSQVYCRKSVIFFACLECKVFHGCQWCIWQFLYDLCSIYRNILCVLHPVYSQFRAYWRNLQRLFLYITLAFCIFFVPTSISCNYLLVW